MIKRVSVRFQGGASFKSSFALVPIKTEINNREIKKKRKKSVVGANQFICEKRVFASNLRPKQVESRGWNK